MIESIYQDFKARLQHIRRNRKKVALAQLFMWGLTGIYFLIMIGHALASLFSPPDFAKQSPADAYSLHLIIPFVIIIFLTTGAAWVFQKLQAKLSQQEEETIVALVNRLFPQLRFQRIHYLPGQEVLRSKMFPNYDPYSPQKLYQMYGYLKATQADVELHMADIGLREDTKGNKFKGLLAAIPYLSLLVLLYEYILKNIFSSKTVDNRYYTFRGLFCWARYHKSMQGHTLVLPDRLEAHLGEFAKLVQGMNFRPEQLVNLEDPRFEKEFVVYSTDQVEARYLLSTAMMEKLMEIRRKFGRPLMVSFTHQHIYLAVSEPNGIFSFASASLTSSKAIADMHEIVQKGLEMVNDLSIVPARIS